MKKHNTVKVVLITILVLALLTWILPAAYFSGEFVKQGRVQVGLFDLFNYPVVALSYFGYIALFVILVGGFYGILYKIPAYRSFLDKLVEASKGKEKFCLSVMIVLIAFLVSICGLHLGIALFVPLVVSLVLLMGFDKMVAAFVTVGSISVGLAGSTYAFNNLSVLEQYLNLGFNYQIGVRFIILLVGIALVIFNTLMYIKKTTSSVIDKKVVKKAHEVKEEKVEVVKVNKEKVAANKKKTSTAKSSSSKSKSTKKGNTKSKSKNANKAALKDEDIIIVREAAVAEELVPAKNDKNHSIWPFIVTFAVLFVLMVLAFVSWGEGAFGVDAFEKATTGVLEFKLFGFPLFGKLLGTVNSFGVWSLTDLFFPMALLVTLLAIIYKVNFDDVLSGFLGGARKALRPAAIVILVYSVLVLVTYHPFQLVIYKALLGIPKGFNIVATSLVAILASVFNADPAYTFQSVVPYFASVVTKVDNYGVAGIIFQSMYGFTMLFAPTSLVLMGLLSFLKINYGEWLKNAFKLIFEFLIILLIIFIILVLV